MNTSLQIKALFFITYSCTCSAKERDRVLAEVKLLDFILTDLTILALNYFKPVGSETNKNNNNKTQHEQFQ